MAAPAGDDARRSWPQRVLIAFNLALIVVCLVAAGGAGYAYWRFEHIPRVDVHNLAVAPAGKGSPVNFLLVGTDTRTFDRPGGEGDEGFGGEADSSGSGRSDTMIVVRVDPRTGTAAMVSFPRDLWVDVPGLGMAKMNSAFLGDEGAGLTGPELLIETIRANFGIAINHYAQVDFHGFKGLVDALGGITVNLPGWVRDWDDETRPDDPRNQTGLEIHERGCVHLDGDQALAYVRSRHLQTRQPDGPWVSERTGDIGRNARQQDVVRRAAAKVMSDDIFDVVRLNALVGVAEKDVKLSSSIEVDDLVNLAKGFGSLTPETLAQYPLATHNSFHYDARHVGNATVDLDADKAVEREAILDVFRGIERPTPVPIATGPSGLTSTAAVAPAPTTTSATIPPPC